jgi:hypothetical protein
VYKSQGLIFWETVSRFDDANSYVRSVLGKTKQGIINEIFEHHFALSNVCSKKYQVLNLGIVTGAVGVFLAIVILIAK